MKAIIVAAGRGKRMMSLTSNYPKSLLKLGKKGLLDYSIGYLTPKMSEIIVVVGYKKEKIIDAYKGKVTFIENKDFLNSNDGHSLLLGLGRAGNSEDVIYIHGDLLYHPKILEMCINAPENLVLMVDTEASDKESMKVKAEGSVFIKSSKDIPISESSGEWIGMAKISRNVILALINTLIKVEISYGLDEYDTRAFNIFQEFVSNRIVIKSISGYPWIEVDTPEDYKKARRVEEAINERLKQEKLKEENLRKAGYL